MAGNIHPTALVAPDAELDPSVEVGAYAVIGPGVQVGANALVTCQGKIVASYNGELQEFNLSARTYVVENSTGEWLVCGAQ